MGLNHQCYILSFVQNGLLVPEKISRVFTIYGPGGHLSHVSQVPQTIFRSGSTKNLAFTGQAVSKEISVKVGRKNHGYTISSHCVPYGSGELKTESTMYSEHVNTFGDDILRTQKLYRFRFMMI